MAKQFIGDERVISLKIDNTIYSVQSDDEYLNFIKRKSSYDPRMIKLFKLLIGEKKHILDIGANIGCTSLFFGENNRTVHSFEPSPSTFAYLTKNIETTNHPNVHLHNIGLGSQNATFTLASSPDNRSGAYISDKIEQLDNNTAETITIVHGDEFIQSIKLPALDFIKIDTEGFEKDVILGLEKTIQHFQPIVVLELNNWCLNAFQRLNLPDFFDYLRSVFPFLYAIHHNEIRDLHNPAKAFEVMYKHLCCGRKFFNIVAAFNKDQLTGFFKEYKDSSSSNIFIPQKIKLNKIKKLNSNLASLFNRFINPQTSQCILDVGAGSGETTQFFAENNCIVHSFEPSTSRFHSLEQRLTKSTNKNVHLHNIGLGKTDTTLPLVFPPFKNTSAYISEKIQILPGLENEPVKIVSGDNFIQSLKLPQINLIKITTNGYEQEVIEGLKQTILQQKPIVAIEVDHFCINALQRTSMPDYLDFLKSLFPLLYSVDLTIHNLHDHNQAYPVLHKHIVRGPRKFYIIGAFHQSQLANLLQNYTADVKKNTTWLDRIKTWLKIQ